MLMARIVTASGAGPNHTSTYCSILYSTECSLRLRANSTFFSAFRSMCGLHGRSKNQKQLSTCGTISTQCMWLINEPHKTQAVPQRWHYLQEQPWRGHRPANVTGISIAACDFGAHS
jgi:hypothetical protein